MARTSRNRGKKAAAAEARRIAAQRAQRRRRVIIIGATGLILSAAVALAVTRPEPVELADVLTFADQGQTHVDPTSPAPDYNSNPPTSGPHGSQPASCGIYRQEVPDLLQIHNLEHGTVVIQYEPGLGASDLSALEDFARAAGTHIVVAPRAGMDHPIVLTAWTKLLGLTTRDDGAIQAFYDRYAQNGPERGVPCLVQTDESAGQ